MSKTKNQRRHFLIVQTEISHGYQVFDAHSAAMKGGSICWPRLNPQTLRVPEDEEGYVSSHTMVRVSVHGQQGCGLRGIEDTNIYGVRAEIQCAHDGYNDEFQSEALVKAWKTLKSRLKKFDALGPVEDYAEVCIRVAAALGYGLATKEEGLITHLDPNGFRCWVQAKAEQAVKN